MGRTNSRRGQQNQNIGQDFNMGLGPVDLFGVLGGQGNMYNPQLDQINVQLAQVQAAQAHNLAQAHALAQQAQVIGAQAQSMGLGAAPQFYSVNPLFPGLPTLPPIPTTAPGFVAPDLLFHQQQMNNAGGNQQN